MNSSSDLKNAIREAPDFPTPGISFKDISPILENPQLFQKAIHSFRDVITVIPDYIVAVDARGFIFGSALAYELKCGLILARKTGKLPPPTIDQPYDLEYGKASLSLPAHCLKTNHQVILVDDVLATGGTALAALQLIQAQNAVCTQALFLIELSFLNGAQRLLPKTNITSLIQYF
jgi:adenine phosphoribosyltransferase